MNTERFGLWRFGANGYKLGNNSVAPDRDPSGW